MQMHCHKSTIFSMIPTIFLLLLLFNFRIPSTLCQSTGKIETVNNFLDRKLREATMEIAKQYAKEESDFSVRPESYDIQWKKLWSEKLKKTKEDLPISVSNRMFLLEDDRLMSVVVKPASEESSSALRQVDLLLRQKSPIKFVKNIVWKAKIYLLVCHNNLEFSGESDACTLYTGNDNSHLQGIQIIKLKGSSKDAAFFTRANRLYLVVADNTGQFPVNSLIYRWMGTYMDIIQWAETTGAVSVTTFNHRSSTILIFGQNAKGQPDIGSEVYELNDGGLEKIQYLATNGPISVGHYFHNAAIYLLVVNEANPSDIYRWDGNEFVHWLDLPDIVGPSAVSIARSKSDTLLFVSRDNFISLYKITSARYWRLNLLEFKAGEKVVDMVVWIADGTTLTLLLVTVDQYNVYKIEPWELRLKKMSNNKFTANIHGSMTKQTKECLEKLHSRLEERTKLLETVVHRVWPVLLNSSENLNVQRLGGFQEIILESGSIAGMNISSDQEILMPEEIEKDFSSASSVANSDLSETRNSSQTNTTSVVFSILADSKKIIRKGTKENRITGYALINKNTFFQEVRIDNLETNFLNEKSINFENGTIISINEDQDFSDAELCGKSVTVRRLEIDKICGIPKEYWQRSNVSRNIGESTKNPLINSDIYVADNETLFIRSNLISLQNLKLRSIDHINLREFFDTVFQRGDNQRIKGNIFHKNAKTSIEIVQLISDELNGIPSEDLWTKKTEQHFRRRIFIDKKASFGNLVVKRINEIPVEKHAMVTKKNTISGPVTISNIRILEELMIENATKFLEDRPVQIYDQVTIIGNVTMKDLILERFTKFATQKLSSNKLTEAKEPDNLYKINIEDLLNSYWRKSTKQIIKNRVTFEKNVTIDKLTVKFLNNIDVDSDVVKTTWKKIVFDDSQGSIEFANFTVSGWIIRETDENETSSLLYDDENDGILSLNTEFRIERLGIHDLYVKNFNGIPLHVILSKKNESLEAFEFSNVDSIQRFETVTINNVIKIDELIFSSINEKIDAGDSFVDLLLRSDENYKLKRLKTKNLMVHELNYSEEAAGKFPLVLPSFFNESLIKKEALDLRIDGNLEIKNDARFRRINNEETQTYLDYLAMDDVAVISDEELIIDYLNISRDLTLNFLYGSLFDSFYDKTLSKTRKQNLSKGLFRFYKISAGNSNVDRINNQRTSDIPMIDSYQTNIMGNVTFSHLKLSSSDENIDAMMMTEKINGYRVDEIYDRLGKISARKIENIEIKGNANWKLNDSKAEGKLERILNRSVIEKPRNQNETQKITSDKVILHGKKVVASSVRVKENSNLNYRVTVPNLESKNRSEYLLDRYSQLKKSIDDFVLDDPKIDTEIELNGPRIFKENFEAHRANVVGNVGIESLNNWRVDDLKSQIIDEKNLFDRQSSIKNNFNNEINDRTRSTDDFQDKNEFIGRTVIFRQSVRIRKLLTDLNSKKLPINSIFNDLSMGSIAFFSPESRFNDSVFFEHLSVLGDVNIGSLDKIPFDDFVENRVTINSDHREIQTAGKLRFKGRIRIIDKATVRTINHVDPSKLLLNGSFENETIVCIGEKIFERNVECFGKTLVENIGGIDVVEEYENAVRNNENVDIYGNVIFESDVENVPATSGKGWQLQKGYINDIPLNMEQLTSERSNLVEELANINRSRIENLLLRASNPSISLPEIFYYFEYEDNFHLNIRGIERVESIRMQDSTRLDIYAKELGNICGLPIDDCDCRKQYIAEIDNSNFNNVCHFSEIRPPRIFYNFRERNGFFGVSVATTTISKNNRCNVFIDRNETIDESITEYTTISWIKSAGSESIGGWEAEITAGGSNLTENSLKIHGFLSDVRVFTENDLVFIVLAIYFDPIRQSHETNSYIYVLDLENNVVKLLQTIPTIHATSVEVFKIPKKGSYVLFSSSNHKKSYEKSAESMLYRLDPLSGQFRLLRSFAIGGNRHSKIVNIPSSEEPYLLLDDQATNSIRVYRYDGNWDNFYFRQSLRSPSMGATIALEILYSDEFQSSDVYVIVTTENDQFFVYEYVFFGGFRLMAHKFISGIRGIVPFDVSMSRRYALVANRGNSTMLRIIQQGPDSVE